MEKCTPLPLPRENRFLAPPAGRRRSARDPAPSPAFSKAPPAQARAWRVNRLSPPTPPHPPIRIRSPESKHTSLLLRGGADRKRGGRGSWRLRAGVFPSASFPPPSSSSPLCSISTTPPPSLLARFSCRAAALRCGATLRPHEEDGTGTGAVDGFCPHSWNKTRGGGSRARPETHLRKQQPRSESEEEEQADGGSERETTKDAVLDPLPHQEPLSVLAAGSARGHHEGPYGGTAKRKLLLILIFIPQASPPPSPRASRPAAAVRAGFSAEAP
ncbi:hypothetical protein FQA47_011647 [Oryzias melastigma]|uniref:Uncharacterized protein n=1 Tax=Oryzias melastigma TaxID=30732 RepID=A0A834FCE8_ORYME|nr:hypothetical protein FQA47_011647 [Oryzias melastigma]